MQNDVRRVTIAKNAYGCIAEPPRVIVRSDSKIVFKVNESIAGSVTIELPAGFSPTFLEIRSGGSGTVEQVSKQEGVYPYTVTCLRTGLRARGASEPEIIIDN